jgi:hypothetical protein
MEKCEKYEQQRKEKEMRNFQLQEAKRKKEEEIAKLKIEEQRKRQEVNDQKIPVDCFKHKILLFHSRKKSGGVNTWQ